MRTMRSAHRHDSRQSVDVERHLLGVSRVKRRELGEVAREAADEANEILLLVRQTPP